MTEMSMTGQSDTNVHLLEIMCLVYIIVSHNFKKKFFMKATTIHISLLVSPNQPDTVVYNRNNDDGVVAKLWNPLLRTTFKKISRPTILYHCKSMDLQ